MAFSFFKKKKTSETEPVLEEKEPEKKGSSEEPISLQPSPPPDLQSDPEEDMEPDFASDELPEPDPIQEPAPQTQVPVQEKPGAKEGTGLLSKLKSGLAKTRTVLNTDVTELFSSSKAINDDLFDELEERLVTSDLGLDITMEMMERIRKKSRGLSTGNQLRQVLKDELLTLFHQPSCPAPSHPKPYVIMMVGVNGTGKTTTLGKLAMKYKSQGKKVLIAAADTFRAAAIEQVEIWARRAGADIVRHKEGADPAAVAYDAVEAAMARGADVVLIDTAGRLHTQKNLMEELKKIKRSVDKKYKNAPHDIMMVIDATTGQNALSQADIFHKAVGLTQISVTKLDGTAKGGIVAAVSATMNLPIAYIGVGEAIEDLQEFEAKRFIDALFD
ncbi:signal recognition particle-docking protein FtsY [uncultured Desulfobacter sp.]|uniref:signal recognition particle-docking protein FtsY n=1 Tax=uncultured Desulfobacter sp. TaxID=240139 RepID=UPI002AAB678D|nr:signal recognition particle-docking protein FtsY [uncultured Desulfobacter sp.]